MLPKDGALHGRVSGNFFTGRHGWDLQRSLANVLQVTLVSFLQSTVTSSKYKHIYPLFSISQTKDLYHIHTAKAGVLTKASIIPDQLTFS